MASLVTSVRELNTQCLFTSVFMDKVSSLVSSQKQCQSKQTGHMQTFATWWDASKGVEIFNLMSFQNGSAIFLKVG